jgi:hypothetical protein
MNFWLPSVDPLAAERERREAVVGSHRRRPDSRGRRDRQRCCRGGGRCARTRARSWQHDEERPYLPHDGVHLIDRDIFYSEGGSGG